MNAQTNPQPRKTVLLRVPADLLRKMDRLTRGTQKTLGPSWSRNDQIVAILRRYEPPEL